MKTKTCSGRGMPSKPAFSAKLMQIFKHAEKTE